MSILAGTVRDDVQRRLRTADALLCASDIPPSTANGQALIFQIMTYAQLFVNAAERLQLNGATITWPGNTIVLSISQQVNPLLVGGTNIMTVLSVQGIGAPLNGREIMYVDWRNLGRHNIYWLSTEASQPNVWTTIGKDLLIINPGNSGPLQYMITYVPTMDNEVFNNDSQIFIIPDDAIGEVTTLLELVLRIKTRQIVGFKDRLVKFAKTVNIGFETGKSTRDDGSAL